MPDLAHNPCAIAGRAPAKCNTSLRDPQRCPGICQRQRALAPSRHPTPAGATAVHGSGEARLRLPACLVAVPAAPRGRVAGATYLRARQT